MKTRQHGKLGEEFIAHHSIDVNPMVNLSKVTKLNQAHELKYVQDEEGDIIFMLHCTILNTSGICIDIVLSYFRYKSLSKVYLCWM